MVITVGHGHRGRPGAASLPVTVSLHKGWVTFITDEALRMVLAMAMGKHLPLLCLTISAILRIVASAAPICEDGMLHFGF